MTTTEEAIQGLAGAFPSKSAAEAVVRDMNLHMGLEVHADIRPENVCGIAAGHVIKLVKVNGGPFGPKARCGSREEVEAFLVSIRN